MHSASKLSSKRLEVFQNKLIQIARKNQKIDMSPELELRGFFKIWFLEMNFSDGKELKQ